jgi:hypothetical protein
LRVVPADVAASGMPASIAMGSFMPLLREDLTFSTPWPSSATSAAGDETDEAIRRSR